MAQTVIDPEKVRRRLDEVWLELGQKADADGHEVMRACALTLIAVVDDEGDADAIAETLAQLMHEHPSRAIVVRLAAGDAGVLEADVDARCWMPFGTRQQICSEQIVIRCSEKTLAEIPSVILPLIVPDLPVVLWSASERATRSPAFPNLAEPAGRVILDSFFSAAPLEALESLEPWLARREPRITDLSWTRLTRWRSLLAQVFENEIYRSHSRQLSEAVIRYEGVEGAAVPPTALLLAGWLAASLGWSCDESRLPAGLRFERVPAEVRPSRLRSFELRAPQPAAMRVAIARSGETCGEVRVEVAGLDPVMNRVSLPRSNALLLLGEELSVQKPDPIFERSLRCAVLIGRALAKR